MSSYYVERFLEDKYEEGLEEGMSKEQAEKYAFNCLEAVSYTHLTLPTSG